MNAEDFVSDIIDYIEYTSDYIPENTEIMGYSEDPKEENIVVYGDYTSFGTIAKALEDMQIEVQKSSLKRIPTSPVEFTEEQLVDIEKMLDKINIS